MGPQAWIAFAKDHQKCKSRHRDELAAFEVALQNRKTWQQDDAQLLIAIINSVNDKLCQELLTIDRNSAAALKLIKSKYPPPQTKDKNKNPLLQSKDKPKQNTKDKGKNRTKS
jgi:16S rRNA C1402 N4-methylase RsmH